MIKFWVENTKERYTVEFRVYKTRTSMQNAHDKFVERDCERLLGSCTRWPNFPLAIVWLNEENLEQEIVAHEIIHATFGWANLRLKHGKKSLCHHANEEKFVTNAENLIALFWEQWNERKEQHAS